ncbi:MAG: hypothetical protein DSZ29_05685 [Aquificaceae bacterium]|nr:MAG: hypothetical protein DSZ29_05685 [Aquificaceae bacterium]
MKILLYNDLDDTKIDGFKKLCQKLKQDNLYAANVKKVGDNLYRARLNRTDRLLFSIYRYKEETYALILEYIKNHCYEKSRFLRRGVKVDERNLPLVINNLAETSPEKISFINKQSTHINLLNKPISFDNTQTEIFQKTLPLIVIGSAGSGKTSLILEKMKNIQGNILYISQSPYLVESSKKIYQSNCYQNEQQQLHFLSFEEFIENIQIPQGKAINNKIFQDWFKDILQSSSIKDGYKLFEEFRGVISGLPSTNSEGVRQAFLSRKHYLSLGIKQSIFLPHEKNAVYDLFQRYLSFLKENNYYDINLICHHYLSYCEKKYDAIIIDEIQDFTSVQIDLVLSTLSQPQNFLFCGDANQVVHPNFFSWAKIKQLCFNQAKKNKEIIHILHSNYRNSAHIIQIANNVLKLKTLRFGSLDKESHYLMSSNNNTLGKVTLLLNEDKTSYELNTKTKNTTHYAVIVIDESFKKAAQQLFDTPLIFTVQEAKGLEYENIILFNFISPNESRYQKICAAIDRQDITQDIRYARNKNKTDKSIEAYKFHINALYVALTRAITNIYWLETRVSHKIFRLLDLETNQEKFSIKEQTSSTDEWQQELQKLEQQGKQQQANSIRKKILNEKPPSWPIYDTTTILELQHQALIEKKRKAKLALFEYALVYDDHFYKNALIKIGFKPAKTPENGLALLHKKYFMNYTSKKLKAVTQLIHRHGVNFRNMFNQTPLMIATFYGNVDLIHLLLDKNADKSLVNNKGHNAFQIALCLAWKDREYAHKKLAPSFFALSPDSLHLRIDKQHIKLDKHSCEFFIINLMMALFYEIIPQKMIFTGGGFTPQDIVEALRNFPSSLITEKLYDERFIGEILSMHKMHNETQQGLKLFYRVMPDNYLINPQIALKINNQWVNIYKLLSFDQLSLAHQKKFGVIDTDTFYSNVLEDMKAQYKGVLNI